MYEANKNDSDDSDNSDTCVNICHENENEDGDELSHCDKNYYIWHLVVDSETKYLQSDEKACGCKMPDTSCNYDRHDLEYIKRAYVTGCVAISRPCVKTLELLLQRARANNSVYSLSFDYCLPFKWKKIGMSYLNIAQIISIMTAERWDVT